ncbi:hypothetical protein Enr13x_23650 [Stieleria neptunia]|uniref:Uncharacterized protein n=2 Tax=Stieleria neptunia TaxID=2527979 RepID=A0A518HP16_9BACT|nr:hypothetical protein Enr13x_23650 [Stieleria neptunia]
MRKVYVAACILTLALGCFFVAGVQAADKSEVKQPVKQDVLVTTVYKVYDLPVYTRTKGFSFDLLMTLIQKSVSPKDWEAKGGKSTMAPYPQNLSLIISTTSNNHKKIAKLLERFRESE